MKTLAQANDRAELLGRLRAWQANDARRWGKMTAHQAVCHLADSFRAMIGEKAVSPQSNWLTRTVLKWIALDLPLPWAHGFPTRPEMNQEIGGTPPVEFARDLEELAAIVERFCSKPADFVWTPHPVFGVMTRTDYLRWGWLHTDHHLRQFGR